MIYPLHPLVDCQHAALNNVVDGCHKGAFRHAILVTGLNILLGLAKLSSYIVDFSAYFF